MVARAEPSRYATQFDSDVRSESEDDSITQEEADSTLRNAIRYMITQGGTHSEDTYNSRVNDIDEYILRDHRNEAYPYGHRLYRELQSLVREAQSELSIADQSSSVSGDSAVSTEEPYSPNALYREYDDSDYAPAGGPRPATPSPRPRGPRNAEILKNQYLYGGPDNEAEEWHKDFPAALPFGETHYMQEWESMKIYYDLAESAKRLHDDNPIVDTNVPCGSVEARFGSSNQYDSGSRFKIPAKIPANWARVEKAAEASSHSVRMAVVKFNEGGDDQDQVQKDYAPRVFLPQVSMELKSHSRSMSARARGKQPVRSNYNPSNYSVTSPAYQPSDPAAGFYYGSPTSPAGYDGPAYSPSSPTRSLVAYSPITSTRTHALQSPTKGAPATKAIRRFEERRAAATRANASTPGSRSLLYVKAGPAGAATRKPGRPGMISSSSSVSPVTAVARVTRGSGRKRKVSDVDYMPTKPEVPAKKVKKTPATTSRKTTAKASAGKKAAAKTPSVRKVTAKPPKVKKGASKTSTAKKAAHKITATKKTSATKPATKKSVDFAKKETPAPRKSEPKRTTRATKDSLKKRTKEAGSVPEVLAKDIRDPPISPMARGATRSGAKYKR